MRLLMRFTDGDLRFVLFQWSSGLYEMIVYGKRSRVITHHYYCNQMIDELLSWY